MKAASISVVILLGTAVVAAASCRQDIPSSQGIATQGSVTPASDWSALLRWGTGSGQAGIRPTRPLRPGTGVSAVGAGSDDGVLLLDRLNRRVLWAGAKGAHPVAQVPEDAEDLATGPDGSFVAYSPYRSRAWVYQGAERVGELAVDRNLRELVGLSLTTSRRLFAHNAFQETYPLGSPAAPRILSASLHGKREGAFLLGDGTGVAVRRTQRGQPELLLLERRNRTRVVARHLLPEVVLAARLVGVAGDVACMKLEQAQAGTDFVVERTAVCHDVRTGARLLERALGAPGLYLPRRELAVGAQPPRLIFIRPDPRGLRVHSWGIPMRKGRQP